MFDPYLWKRTKASAISLLVIGGILLLPAGYVFYLAHLLMPLGGVNLTSLGAEAALFWSALIGSCAGVLAWISLCLLLFQRRDIRIHRLVWHLVRFAGGIIVLGLAAWFRLVTNGGPLHLNHHDSLIFLTVLIAILATALLLMCIGHRNLRFTRAAAQRAAAANLADSERICESTP